MLLLLLFKPIINLEQRFKHTIILLILLVGFVACRQTKNVPRGEYLLKKNKIEVQGEEVEEYELEEIIRQKPNFKRVYIKWNLMMFNSVDSARVANKRARKNLNLREKNQSRRDKQARINAKRIDRAQRKDTPHHHQDLSTRYAYRSFRGRC